VERRHCDSAALVGDRSKAIVAVDDVEWRFGV